MKKSSKIIALIEPEIESIFKDLADKKGMSASGLTRSLIIDELQLQGLLPQEFTMYLLKGAGA